MDEQPQSLTRHHFQPIEFPHAGPDTVAARRAALEDLRSEGTDEDDLGEIAQLWRREDEILATARASAEARRPTSPLTRARINHEQSRLDAIESPLVRAEEEALREECEELLDSFPHGTFAVVPHSSYDSP